MRYELEAVLDEIRKAIVGKDEVVKKILTAMLAEGHILLDDVPGVGKTTLAVAFSRAMGLEYHRIQFTPDVLPSDIVGFSIYDKESGNFVYRPGVLNGANLLLGDEINRTSGRTQSALLEAMEERQVTVDGNTYPMEKPFIVIATQNSVGTAGTHFLPYAQIDRFLVRLSLGYPDHEAQMRMMRDRRMEDPLDGIRCVLQKDDLLRMQREVREVTVKDCILDYISRLASASREHPMVEIGISPRGAIFLDRLSRAAAYAEGRDYVTSSDVRAVFSDVCAHRILLNRKAYASGEAVSQVLDSLLQDVEVPDSRA